MKSIKVVAGYFNKTSARKEAAYQRKLAKQNGKEIIEIGIKDAAHLYYTEPFFKLKMKKFGSPMPGQLAIVIYYKESSEKACSIEKPIVKPTVKPLSKTISLSCKNKSAYNRISKEAVASKNVIDKAAKAHNSHIIPPTFKRIRFYPSYYMRMAA